MAETTKKEEGFDYVRAAMDEYPGGIKVALNIILFLIWVFFKIFYPYKIENEERFFADLKRRGCMVVQNHVSMVEPVVMVISCWRHGVHVRPVYKAEFEKIGAAKWLFRRAGGIPVDRGKADMRAIRAAKEALQRGECVLIYPEGTRLKSDDDVPEMHGGFAMMAQMANAPVIATAVVGAADPYKTRKTLRRKPFIATNPAIEWESLEGPSRKEKQQQMEKLAMEQVYELRGQLREEHPGLW